MRRSSAPPWSDGVTRRDGVPCGRARSSTFRLRGMPTSPRSAPIAARSSVARSAVCAAATRSRSPTTRRTGSTRGGLTCWRCTSSVRLHLQFARAMAQRQQLWLTTLDLDGKPAAAWYGFASGDTVYFYQGGRDPRWERESVGLVLMGIMIQRAIERGYRAFNFLRGDDGYKRQWTASRRKTGEAVVFRSGWRGRWLRMLDAVAELRARAAR